MLKPIMGSVNGYGSVAKAAINDNIYRRTIRPMGGPKAPGYAGVASAGTRKSPLANEVRAANRGSRTAKIDAAKRVRASRMPVKSALGGVDTGLMHGPALPAANKMRMNKRSLMGIGLGLGVAAGVAMNRRGEGASSGRQSMYKY